MSYGKRAVLSVARGLTFLGAVVVVLPLLLFDYLRVVLATTGTGPV